jgi:nucleoside triphosphate diphosphatase
MKSENDTSRAFDRALDLVRFLRDRCDWDARQTPESLVPYLLEEAHEVADAIVDDEPAALAGELGDLLLNVAFQTVIAEERGRFDREEVVQRLEAKMRRRHPHLYGDGPPGSWEQMKAQERAPSAGAHASVLDGLARGLDPLSRAQRIQDRVSAVGFDWPDAGGAYAKVEEELREVGAALDGDAEALEEELGDLLFAAVNLARLAGAHALRALQRANAKFTDRFLRLEHLARERGIVLGEASLDELDALWDEIKEQRAT